MLRNAFEAAERQDLRRDSIKALLLWPDNLIQEFAVRESRPRLTEFVAAFERGEPEEVQLVTDWVERELTVIDQRGSVSPKVAK